MPLSLIITFIEIYRKLLIYFVEKVSLQNCMNCTKIIFNFDGEDVVKLKKMSIDFTCNFLLFILCLIYLVTLFTCCGMWDNTESPS